MSRFSDDVQRGLASDGWPVELHDPATSSTDSRTVDVTLGGKPTGVGIATDLDWAAATFSGIPSRARKRTDTAAIVKDVSLKLEAAGLTRPVTMD